MDVSETMRLDGNAVAGILQEIFAAEMTTCPAECEHCGQIGALGSLLAYTHAPGIVLCCPSCGGIILRMVIAGDEVYLDARGAKYVKIRMK
jgi:Zn finger protein HypA/HybF involved in hydrogenase expression